MIFTPLKKTKDFETIGTHGLWHNWVADTLPPGDVLDVKGTTQNQLWDTYKKVIIDALATGALPACVYVESENQFYRVPSEFWGRSGFMEGELHDTLFCWSNSDVPAKFHDLPVLFFRDDVDTWEAEIRQTDVNLDDVDLDWDSEYFDDCLKRAGVWRLGYWSPFSTLAWIISRDERFVSGVQLFESEQDANRGGDHSAAAWMTIGNSAGERFGITLTMAASSLREVLEDGGVQDVVATSQRTEEIQAFPKYLWTKWVLGFQRWGLQLVPGYFDFKFSSAQVRQAFPCEPVSAKEPSASTDQPERWQAQKVTPQQAMVFEFFNIARANMPGGSHPAKTSLALRGLYVDWLSEQRGVWKPFKRTAFNKMLSRHKVGWRIEGSRWEMSQ